MGDFTQLSISQREVVYRIYTQIGIKPFKAVDHRDLFDYHMLTGLRMKGALKKYHKKWKERGNTWILTNVGITEALRHERTL
jgi:hypothetical protein